MSILQTEVPTWSLILLIMNPIGFLIAAAALDKYRAEKDHKAKEKALRDQLAAEIKAYCGGGDAEVILPEEPPSKITKFRKWIPIRRKDE